MPNRPVPRPARTRVPDRELLTTAQVARLLGVKTQTVYAYVSRGQLSPTHRDGRRASYFAPEEVEALQRRSGSLGRGTGLAESVRTTITRLEGDRLAYRGRDATVLAETASVEEVAGLLWGGDEPVSVVVEEDALADVRAGLVALPEGARLVERLRLAVLLLTARDARRHDLDPSAVRERAGRLIATATAALLPREAWGSAYERSDQATRWTAVVGGDPRDASLVDLVRRALVLLTDHDMAASTTAVRVSASVRADLGSCLLAGLSAMDSPLHGSAGVRARLLLEAAVADPAGTLGRVLADPGQAAGFGHRVYRDSDPRAEQLLGRLRAGGLGELEGPTSLLEEGLWDRHGLFPNSDWALAVLTHRHALAGDASEAVFAGARLVGWVAHTLEEYAEEPLRFRLMGVYQGPRDPA
ncbi:helix-turn-helix domain-containing protein [Arsenicicoccus sp. MKL-02]|uniref:citrate synthase (unknown stereospecificity) n=1 Tax=Arsenicicoccus cauae TaxID=2663847 RepID=A0A6I3IVV1_9MICO|nr:citrate/2-methylcitrate synthase [Arsenicicoccus cauae]MTB72599.1 helix-turn-helix domain-containing protein [Arsenicicoccus cauae]